MVNKIASFYECPADVVLLRFIDTHLYTYYKLGFTPNMITTISILCGILAAYLIFQSQYVGSVIFFTLAYYFDCVDGKLARRYHMATPFGDWYDHFGDLFKFIVVSGALFYNRKQPHSLVQNIFKQILLVMAFMMVIHLGYQETLYGNEESISLNMLKRLVHFDPDPMQTIHFTKHFGTGNFILFFIILILLWRHFAVPSRSSSAS
jgi:phosphatidylglycerophosphate synthase